MGYKHIAAGALITVQIQDNILFANILDNVHMLNVL